MVGEGVDAEGLTTIAEKLTAAGAVPRFLGSRLGRIEGGGQTIEIDGTLEALPSVLFDGVVVPDGDAADALSEDGRSLEFLKDQYRHCKPILVMGQGNSLLEEAGIPMSLPEGGSDPGIIESSGKNDASGVKGFIEALAAHRHFERETDPPRV